MNVNIKQAVKLFCFVFYTFGTSQIIRLFHQR